MVVRQNEFGGEMNMYRQVDYICKQKKNMDLYIAALSESRDLHYFCSI